MAKVPFGPYGFPPAPRSSIGGPEGGNQAGKKKILPLDLLSEATYNRERGRGIKDVRERDDRVGSEWVSPVSHFLIDPSAAQEIAKNGTYD